MPSSFPENIPSILRIIEQVKPQTIVDIGFGRGKYGLLAKEYFGGVKVIGLDVFEDYVTPTIEAIYDEIIISNALEMLLWPMADLFLIIDVIEHWPKDKAHELLQRLITLRGKVIVATPKTDIPQGIVNGNIWERHQTFWEDKDFDRYERTNFSNELSTIYLLD